LNVYSHFRVRKTYEKFVNRLELGFQTLRVDIECILVVLVELHSGLKDVFKAVTGHSRAPCRWSHGFESDEHASQVSASQQRDWTASPMANASFKRIGYCPQFLEQISVLTHSLTASQNEAAIKNMLYGHVLGNLLPLLIRVLFRWQAFRQSKKAIALYFISVALSHFLYKHLKKMGTPRRDSAGNLVSPGDDLNQPGMTEWIFDILYISCEFINRYHFCIRPS
jgi:hypothetical protein